MDSLSLHTHNLSKQIREDIASSSLIYILSSFIMRSGVNVIFDELQEALTNGADVKILTGDYLYITQPEALKQLTSLEGNNIEIRLWKSDGISFHPKSFIFKHREEGAIIVGSSNLSRSALTSGIVWNMRMKRHASPTVFDEAIGTFVELFYDEKTMAINKETISYYENEHMNFHAKHADLVTTWTKREEIEMTLATEQIPPTPIEVEETVDYEIKITPRRAQK